MKSAVRGWRNERCAGHWVNSWKCTGQRTSETTRNTHKVARKRGDGACDGVRRWSVTNRRMSMNGNMWRKAVCLHRDTADLLLAYTRGTVIPLPGNNASDTTDPVVDTILNYEAQLNRDQNEHYCTSQNKLQRLTWNTRAELVSQMLNVLHDMLLKKHPTHKHSWSLKRRTCWKVRGWMNIDLLITGGRDDQGFSHWAPL